MKKEIFIGKVFDDGSEYVYFESYCSDYEQNGDEYSCVAYNKETLQATCYFNAPKPPKEYKFICDIGELPAYKKSEG